MGQPPADGWFRQRAEAFGDVFFILRIRPDVAMEFISEGVEVQSGFSAQDFFEHPHLLQEHGDPTLLQMSPGDRRDDELRWSHPDGSVRWTQVSAVCLERSDGSHVLEGIARDITTLREAQRALADSEEKYRLLAENAWDVIWTMGLDGTVTYVSPSVERVRGITPAEAAAQTIDQIHPPESQARVMEYYQRLFGAIAQGGELPTFRGEQEYYRKDGSIMIGELQVIPQVDSQGNVVQILGVTRDISDRKQWEADLARLAVTDSLTGAYNRRHGQELMSAMIAGGEMVSLLMLDLDHFKQVNDTLGHRAGDQALVNFSQAIRALLRPGDIFARWGGEEFVVLVPCNEAVAVQRAEAMREAVATGGVVTASIGVATGAGSDLEELLHAADGALYQAKADGRNCVRVGRI